MVPWLPPIESASGRVTFTDSGFTCTTHAAGCSAARWRSRAARAPRGGRGTRARRRFVRSHALLDQPLRKHLSGSLATSSPCATGRRRAHQLRIAAARAGKRASSATCEAHRRRAAAARRGESGARAASATACRSRWARSRTPSCSAVRVARWWYSARRCGSAPRAISRSACPSGPGTLVYGSLPRSTSTDGCRCSQASGEDSQARFSTHCARAQIRRARRIRQAADQGGAAR